MTSGFSVNYLIQAQYLDSDTPTSVLPYYNSDNPESPLNGPGNTGAAQPTMRRGLITIAAKAGTAATSGSQATPAADSGYIGLYVVTVAFGQTTITSGNISSLIGAPFISETLIQKISQTTADSRYLQLYARTPNERAVFVVPTNLSYPQGYVERYGAVGDGVTDDSAAINNALLVGGQVVLQNGKVYAIGSAITFQVNNTDLVGYGATIKALPNTNFQFTVTASNLNNISMRGIIVDANQANRSSVLTTRAMGISYTACTNSLIEACTAQNTIGGPSSISAVGISLGGIGSKNRVSRCIAQNCGITGFASDGFFMSGNQNLIEHCVAYNCLDTGFAMESSNQSGIVGCSVRTDTGNASAGAAITNAINTDCTGNFIDGLTIYGWNSSVTGGIQIGTPLSSSTGNLLNTRVSNITIERTSGAGPAINVRQTGVPITKGLVFDNIKIKGAGTQCMLIQATDVVINGLVAEGSTVNAVVSIESGSANVTINNPHISGTFNFGIASDSTANVRIVSPIIVGDQVNTTQGVYFFNSQSLPSITGCYVISPIITGATTAQIGIDAGTVPTIVPIPANVGVTYSSSMTFDAGSGTSFSITASNSTAFTINAPLHSSIGQEITVMIRNNSGGSLGAATWNSIFKMASWTQPGGGSSRSIIFRFDGSNWVEVSRTASDVPN